MTHIEIFVAFFSSLVHYSVFLAPFHILGAIPYSSKGMGACTFNSGQILVPMLHSTCMWNNQMNNQINKTVKLTIEEQNRRKLIAVAILRNEEAILGLLPWLCSVKLRQDSHVKVQH